MAKKKGKEFSIEDQIQGMTSYLNRMRELCRYMKIRFTVQPTAYFWRNRFQATQLLLQGSDVLHTDPGDESFIVGATLKKWRTGTEQKKRICRKILETALATRGAVNSASIEVALNGDAKRSSILKVLNDAVELGLFTKHENGGLTQYRITKLAVEEAAERAYCKLLDPRFLEMCHYAVALSGIHQAAVKTGINERSGKLLPSDHQGLIERLYWGDDGRPD